MAKSWNTAKGKAADRGKRHVKVKSKTAALDSLYRKGRCDRKLVKKATKMTREQWLKHQHGMDEKWPLPEYMDGVKGTTHFKDETYSFITRWTANTRIHYRPHAKAPGSKSHLRYERYSLATTVGEALAFGSYPLDWCWDYERGFIKVLGGHIRDEPVDPAKLEESQLTQVDTAIHSWYKRELAKKLGVKVADLGEHQGWGESLVIRGQRMLAQKEAKERLEAADKEGRRITDEEVFLTLKRWPFFRNPWRQNVMKPGQEWVFSDTLGLLRDRQGDIHLTAPTRRYPQVAELLARWLTDRLPTEAKGFKFTSMNLNCNYAAALHRDAGNLGPSFIKAFGDFTGGKLNYWPDDAGGRLDKLPKDGSVSFDLQKGLALFNGNCAHSVEAFKGSRYSIVYFTIGCYDQVQGEDKAKLQQLCFPYPGAREDPYAMLREPRGYHGAGSKVRTPTRAKKGELPAWRFWRNEELKQKRQTKRQPKSKRKTRLDPENARSFYRTEQRRLRQGYND